MTTWEETQENEKTWHNCQMFFENACIARKRYIDEKGQANNNINKITKEDLNLYFIAIDAKAAQENKRAQQAHPTSYKQNTTLPLIKQNKNLIGAMNKDKPAPVLSGSITKPAREAKNWWCKH